MSLKAKMRWRRDFLTKEMTKSTIENNKSPREARPRRPTTKLKKATAMGAGFGIVKYEKKVGRIGSKSTRTKKPAARAGFFRVGKSLCPEQESNLHTLASTRF